MAELITFADCQGNVHYVAWAHIVDVYFNRNGSAYVVTLAQGTAEKVSGQSHQFAVKGDTAEALRALFDRRAEAVGDIAAAVAAAADDSRAVADVLKRR